MPNTVCPITGRPATDNGPTAGDWESFTCAAAGGRYEITRTALEDLPGHLKAADRPRLVDWLVNKRLSGDKVPRVTTAQLELGALPPQPTIATRLERLLLCLETASPRLGASVPYDLNVQRVSSDQWSSCSSPAALSMQRESRSWQGQPHHVGQRCRPSEQAGRPNSCGAGGRSCQGQGVTTGSDTRMALRYTITAPRGTKSDHMAQVQQRATALILKDFLGLFAHVRFL